MYIVEATVAGVFPESLQLDMSAFMQLYFRNPVHGSSAGRIFIHDIASVKSRDLSLVLGS